ncbi:MAG: hypothetical protein IPO92_14125 [Saprospiraceae bacterium]|nr:hypothetical protein [Saprospiraceae bacterium]
MKPVIIEPATQHLQDIIAQTEKEFNNEVKITPGEARRIDLIRRMKEDTDKREYMIMFNTLIIVLSVSALTHYFYYGTWFSLIFLFIGLVFFGFIRQRLKHATVYLGELKNDFDRYLWEGFHLKEMRYTAVKIGYILFFPVLAILLADLVSDRAESLSIWINLIIAGAISTIAWLIYFSDDQKTLDSIESDLKSLEYL